MLTWVACLVALARFCECGLPLEIGTPAGFTLRFDHHTLLEISAFGGMGSEERMSTSYAHCRQIFF